MDQMQRTVWLASGFNLFHQIDLNNQRNKFKSEPFSLCHCQSPQLDTEPNCSPSLLHYDEYVKRIEGGTFHNIVLTNKNRVFALGRGSELGYTKTSMIDCESTTDLASDHQFNSYCNELSRNSLLKNKIIHKVACGREHTIVLTRDGEVYSFGNNNHGQCGVKGSTTLMNRVKYPHCVMEPTRVDLSAFLFPSVKKVACGQRHTILLCEDGRLMAFGDNSCGQLGLGHTFNCFTPQIINTMNESIESIHCGGFHTIILTKSHNIHVMGRSLEGQLGLNGINHQNVSSPTPLLFFQERNLQVTRISCGERHTLFLTSVGSVFSTGNNYNGCCGIVDPVTNLPKRSYIHQPECISFLEGKSICQISCGSLHSLFGTISGDYYACGSNEEGQLSVIGEEDGQERVHLKRCEYLPVVIPLSKCEKNYKRKIFSKSTSLCTFQKLKVKNKGLTFFTKLQHFSNSPTSSGLFSDLSVVLTS